MISATTPASANCTIDKFLGIAQGVGGYFGSSEPPQEFERNAQEAERERKCLRDRINETVEKLERYQDYDIEDLEDEVEVARKELEELITQLSDGSELDYAATNALRWMKRQRNRAANRGDIIGDTGKKFAQLWDNEIDVAEALIEELGSIRRKLIQQLKHIKNAEAILEELAVLQKAVQMNNAIGEAVRYLAWVSRELDSFTFGYEAPDIS